MLSGVILAKNVENTIADSVVNLSFCDEILVVDDDSKDNTALNAAKAGASVLTHSLNGHFDQQRNYALSKAEGDWILFVDSDEEVPLNLQEEIKRAIDNGNESVGAYYLKRRDIWWGRELKYGEVFDVAHNGLIRLMKKNKGEWSGTVHETFKTKSKTKTLDNFLIHRPHPTLTDFLSVINKYSTIKADELYASKIQKSIILLVLIPPLKFISTYIFKLGFLEGAAGFAYSFLMSFHSFLVRAKLYALYVKKET